MTNHLEKDFIIVLIIIGIVTGKLILDYNHIDKLQALILGIFVACIFGIIDSLFFLSAETTLDDYLEREKIPKKIIPLVVGAISSAISLVIANYVNTVLKGKYSIAESPVIDALGIIIGTLVIAVIYFVTIKKK